jgi:hypothetical protein
MEFRETTVATHRKRDEKTRNAAGWSRRAHGCRVEATEGQSELAELNFRKPRRRNELLGAVGQRDVVQSCSRIARIDRFHRFRPFSGKGATVAPSSCSLLPRGRRERHGDRSSRGKGARRRISAESPLLCFQFSTKLQSGQASFSTLLAQPARLGVQPIPRRRRLGCSRENSPRLIVGNRKTKVTAWDRNLVQKGAIVKSPRLEAPEIDCAPLGHECASMGTLCLQHLNMSASCCMLCERPLPVVASITILLARQQFGVWDLPQPVFADASTSAVVLCWPSSEF